jgi:hypothetical protein
VPVLLGCRPAEVVAILTWSLPTNAREPSPRDRADSFDVVDAMNASGGCAFSRGGASESGGDDDAGRARRRLHSPPVRRIDGEGDGDDDNDGDAGDGDDGDGDGDGNSDSADDDAQLMALLPSSTPADSQVVRTASTGALSASMTAAATSAAAGVTTVVPSAMKKPRKVRKASRSSVRFAASRSASLSVDGPAPVPTLTLRDKAAVGVGAVIEEEPASAHSGVATPAAPRLDDASPSDRAHGGAGGVGMGMGMGGGSSSGGSDSRGRRRYRADKPTKGRLQSQLTDSTDASGPSTSKKVCSSLFCWCVRAYMTLCLHFQHLAECESWSK